MTVLACILLTLAPQQKAIKPERYASQAEATPAATARGNAQVSENLIDEFQDDKKVRDVFNSEINKPAYRRLRTRLKRFENPELDVEFKMPNWWNRFWTWVGSWFTFPTGGGVKAPGFSFGGFSGLSVLVWCLLGIVLAVIVAYIIKSAAVRVGDESERRRLAGQLDSDALQPSTPPGEIPSDEYMHRAIEFAREGDHRRALRQLVLGGMSWIERAGLIRFRKGLTNRDYVRAVYRREQQRRRFAGIILDFEKVYFGRRDASEDQFQECLADYKSAFGQPLDAETAAREDETTAATATARPDEVAVTEHDLVDQQPPAALPEVQPPPPATDTPETEL